MSIRDLLVLGIVLLSLPTVFRKPFVGLLLFSWLAYMRPQDLCWGFARTMRFSFFVGITMMVGWAVNESHKRRFFTPDPRTYLLVGLGLLISVSLAFAREYSPLTARYYFEFLKILVIAVFTLSQVDSRKRLNLLLGVICVSLAFYSVKNGLMGFVRGGTTILRGPGGMLEDNNDFALALVMNIPLVFYLSRLVPDRRVRLIGNVALFLTVVTVLLTHSRGGFLAMSATILWIAWRSGKLIQSLLTLLMMAVGFVVFAPAHVLERIWSITEGSKDDSAASRLESWAVALRMIADNPVWGVGLRNFVIASPDYGAEIRDERVMHVAHNSYLQIAAEGGMIAFAVYMSLLLSVFLSCRWMRRIAVARPDLQHFGVYARMFEATLIGFMVGSTFLNRGHFDLIYHFIGIAGATVLIARSEVRAGAPATSDAAIPSASNKVVTVHWRSPLDHEGVPRWERTS